MGQPAHTEQLDMNILLVRRDQVLLNVVGSTRPFLVDFAQFLLEAQFRIVHFLVKLLQHVDAFLQILFRLAAVALGTAGTGEGVGSASTQQAEQGFAFGEGFLTFTVCQFLALCGQFALLALALFFQLINDLFELGRDFVNFGIAQFARGLCGLRIKGAGIHAGVAIQLEGRVVRDDQPGGVVQHVRQFAFERSQPLGI